MKSYHDDLRNEYYRDAFVAVDLLEIQLYADSGTAATKYFTNSGMNINAPSTLTGQTVVYTAQGDFLGFTTMTENMDTTVGKFNISLTGLNQTLLTDIVTSSTEGKRVLVKKAFLNPTTLQLIREPVLVYEGYIYNYAVTESSRSCALTLSCASLFSDFERTAGRKTNNWSNWLFQGVQYDRAMDKAGFVGQTEFLWGRSK
jgi:hypothetical protein